MTQGQEYMMYEKRMGTAFIQSYQEKDDRIFFFFCLAME